MLTRSTIRFALLFAFAFPTDIRAEGDTQKIQNLSNALSNFQDNSVKRAEIERDIEIADQRKLKKERALKDKFRKQLENIDHDIKTREPLLLKSE
jgi:hypothetical protein